MLKKSFVNDTVQVEFSVDMQEADVSAYLVGDFNNWDKRATPMERTENGRWQATLQLKPNSCYHFQYLINQQHRVNEEYADGYVKQTSGQTVSVVSTAVTQPAAIPHHKYQRILLPFVCTSQLQTMLSPALELASQITQRDGRSPKLILLHITPDTSVSHTQTPENLYSQLRALQAQLQSVSFSSRIDTTCGQPAEVIANYATSHHIDAIIMPEAQEEVARPKTFRSILQHISTNAHCDAFIIETQPITSPASRLQA
jgi:nucleotide-binding universal stress UspA family protein